MSRVRRALADRYRVERVLGEGGMATVYLAHDLRHRRQVAIKVMRPELAATVGAGRFLREIEIAAQLSHPHILPVYDSGEASGILYYVMPHVEGESLRERLQREGAFPLEEAVRLAREIAEALAYAHARGIIHRDIKPANILLSAGHALVMDFGIARALEGGEVLTQTGLAVGTPQYMSPEQASGSRAVDARADIYAVGGVLYEMLVGEPPFTGPTPQAILARSLTEEARPLRATRPELPPAVESVVARALAKSPADRQATAAELTAALDASLAAGRSGATTSTAEPRDERGPRRWLSARIVAAGAVLAVALVAVALMTRRPSTAGDGGVIRLAVLPFENLGNAEDAYFADGMADEVRGKLTALPEFQVTARSSSVSYRDAGKSAQEIGRELGVDYLLSATIRWAKSSDGTSRVQVVPELIDVRTGAARWQQPFDANLTDVFEVQRAIATRVASALNVELAPLEERGLAERPTDNLAAYDAYLKAEEARQVPNRRRAVTFYEQAVALDSTFALAWARLAESYANIYYGSPTPEAAEGALRAAERARALAPNDPASYLALGAYYENVVFDHPRAEQQYAAALRLSPNHIELLVGRARVERSLGRWESALELLRRAQTLDPRSSSAHSALATVLLWLRRYPEALAAADRALALSPTSVSLLQGKAMIYLAQGDLQAARAVLRSAPPEVEQAQLVSWVATIWDLYWLLDDEQQRVLLRLPPSAFDDERGAWAAALAATHLLRGDTARSRAYGDSARLAFEEQLARVPDDNYLLALYSVAAAYAGRRAEAIRAGERSVELLPISKDAYSGAYNRHELARVYAIFRDADKTLDHLEALLATPYFLSPGWLRIDPAFAFLKGNPRFERLVGKR